MLKGINSLLNAEVLYALRAMGHGDDLIIADTNFPSDSVARETVLGELLRIDAPAAKVVKTGISLDVRIFPSSSAFSNFRWEGSSVFSCPSFPSSAI